MEGAAVATDGRRTGRSARAAMAAGETAPTDARGIMREGGPLIGLFTDPAGNVFSVLQQD